MKVAVPEELLPAEELGRVHFVGIGGAGLSGIARIMLARGIPVSGSDGVGSPALDALRALGARVHVGHDAEQLGDADTVVVSTAVREDNPEYVEALARGLRVLPRSAALAAVMAGERVVAVAGTHGKTTTTALLTVALQAAGADPTYAVGGDLTATGVNAAEGSGDLFVAEADESDGAFLVYRPQARDRHQHRGRPPRPLGDRGCLRRRRSTSSPPTSTRTASWSAASTTRERPPWPTGSGRPAAGWSRSPPGRGSATWAPTPWPACRCGRPETTTWPTRSPPSRRAGRSATPTRRCVRGIAAFTGNARRMEPKGEAGGVRVYDSYAHHPTEIAGDLAAARELAGEGRLVVAFQPHLVSRTRAFGAAMGQALGAADEVVVCDVYLAREDRDPEVTGALVAAAVPLPPEHVAFVADLDDVPAALVARAQPGDLVLTLGAGSITELGPRVLALLEAGRA